MGWGKGQKGHLRLIVADLSVTALTRSATRVCYLSAFCIGVLHRFDQPVLHGCRPLPPFPIAAARQIILFQDVERLQNAMTSSEERASAEAEGYCISVLKQILGC